MYRRRGRRLRTAIPGRAPAASDSWTWPSAASRWSAATAAISPELVRDIQDILGIEDSGNNMNQAISVLPDRPRRPRSRSRQQARRASRRPGPTAARRRRALAPGGSSASHQAGGPPRPTAAGCPAHRAGTPRSGSGSHPWTALSADASSQWQGSAHRNRSVRHIPRTRPGRHQASPSSLRGSWLSN